MDCRLQPLPGVLHLTTKSFKRVLQHTAPERGEGAARHGKHLHRVGVLEVALVGSGGSPWEKWHTVPRRTDLDGLGCPVNVRGEWALLSWSVGGWVGWLIGRSIGCLVAWSVAGFGCLPTHPYTYRESQRFTQHLRDTKTQVYKNIQACARTEFPWRPQAILTGPTPGPETRREAVSRITPTRLPTGRASSCRGNCTSSCVCVCVVQLYIPFWPVAHAKPILRIRSSTKNGTITGSTVSLYIVVVVDQLLVVDRLLLVLVDRLLLVLVEPWHVCQGWQTGLVVHIPWGHKPQTVQLSNGSS